MKQANSRKSKLLFDEYPLVVNPQLAKEIGLNEAIVLQQVHYWVTINEESGKNEHDGYFWTFNTLKEWASQFPFWSPMTIRRTIKSLEGKGLLVTGCYNKMRADKTKWYRVNQELLSSMNSPCVQFEQSNSSKRTSQVFEKSIPVPETTSETTTKNTPKTTEEATASSPSPLDVVFTGMREYYGYPIRTDIDPIPNYGKEGKAIKRMLDRGFEPPDIIAFWIKKVQKAGKFKSMVYVNEDIGVGPALAERTKFKDNFQFFHTMLCRSFAKENGRQPDGGEMASLGDWIRGKILDNRGYDEILAGPSCLRKEGEDGYSYRP